jgi:choline dehydrogenase-like flavoprotein
VVEVLSDGQRRVLRRVCELLVPGSASVAPEEYVALVMAGMSAADEDATHAAIGLLAGVSDPTALARFADSAAFERLRRLAIEAYYGDFAPQDHIGPTGHDVIGFAPPQAARLRKDWSFLGAPARHQDSDPPGAAEVVVVGSGAGGGLIAADLAQRGLDVLLVEAGGLHQADSHVRFELQSRSRLWWPTRFAHDPDGASPPVALLAGRCVGGSTVINTKVAMRAGEADLAKFHRETGLHVDLEPWYTEVERALGVRERADWTPSTKQVQAGFQALQATFEPVHSYTDFNCTRCGSCLDGCPSNAGRSTLNTFLAPVLGSGRLRLRTHCAVDRVLLASGSPRVTGVEYTNEDGRTGVIPAQVVVLAAGALETPRILLRSNDFTALDTASTRLVGRTLGLHPARLVYGRFDEPQDCHQVYPITAHCLDHQRDEDGGFVVEGTTIQEPVSFAESLVDERNRPMWGARLAEAARAYRYWSGLLVMATDENTGLVELNASEEVVVTKRFSPIESDRMTRGLDFARSVLHAAGAREVVWSGLSTTHMQGSVRMGSDPERSVVNADGRAHDVDGLYVGDASLVPASLSVNPSLTIMALAAKVADAVSRSVA